MEGALLLDVIIREGATILELFTGENETLLIGRNTFLVLNLALDVVDRVTGFDLEGNWWEMSGIAPKLGQSN